MAAPSPLFTPVTTSAEIASTDCAEEGLLQVHDPPVRARGIWKVAASLATVMGLLSVATTFWTRTRTLTMGDKVTGLADVPSFTTVDGIGCSNWRDIEIFRKVVDGPAQCEALCEANPQCTSFNFQAAACAPGSRGWKPNGCLLFKGECAWENNDCWQLGTKVETEPCITEKEMNQTIEAFYGAVVAIGANYEDCAAAKEAALGALNAAYAYNNVDGVTVQFKPTLTELPDIYRPTQELALSYFVGPCVCPGADAKGIADAGTCSEEEGLAPGDFGFAFGPSTKPRTGWAKVEAGGAARGGNPETNFWYNVNGPFCHAPTAQGPVCFWPPFENRPPTCVDKTFGFVRNPKGGQEGQLPVLLSTHHSSSQIREC